MKKICKGRFEFEVFSTHAENYAHLQKLGISSVIFSYSLMDKLLAKIGINSLWQAIQSRIKIIGSFEKKLIKHKNLETICVFKVFCLYLHSKKSNT